MLGRLPTICALAAVAAVLWAATTARADDAAYPMFGVNVNRVFNDDFWGVHWDDRLGGVQSSGIGLARTDAFWDWAEPNPPQNGTHTYDWSITDSVAAALTRHDLRWLPILDYSAPWASSDPNDTHAPPSSNDDYAAYAGAFARRFGRGGSFWDDHPSLQYSPVTTYEIWNEENGAWFWRPAPDPARYIDMYLKARAAIKAVDPSATVLIGGLVPGNDYVKAMIAARPEAAGEIDGVAFHPYASTVDGVLARVRSLRSTLEALGMGSTPIHITELGWATSGTGSPVVTTEDQRAKNMAQATDTLARSDCGIAGVIPYTWTTPEVDPSNVEDWYGITHWDGGGRTPTADAYTGVVQQWAGHPVAATDRIPVCHPPPAADLSTVTSASAPMALTGTQLTYTITVANAGSAAQGASVLAAVPLNASLVSASASNGSCAPGRFVSCALGTLGDGQTAQVTVVVRADAPGTLASAASASSSTPDPDSANNVSTVNAIASAPPFPGVTLRTQRLTVKKGRAAFTIGCPGAVYGGCAGQLSIGLSGSRKPHFALAAGANRAIVVRLSRRAVAAVARRKRVRVTIAAHDGAAQARSRHWTLRVIRVARP